MFPEHNDDTDTSHNSVVTSLASVKVAIVMKSVFFSYRIFEPVLRLRYVEMRKLLILAGSGTWIPATIDLFRDYCCTL